MGTLDHGLAPHFDALRAMRTRKQLERSELWKQIGGEIERVLDGIDVRSADDAKPLGAIFRAAAWNIQRGAHLDRLIAAFRDDPALARADVLMLSEVDDGMGRSGNRHVARELADALGMNYAFAVSYVALEDDFGENAEGVASTLALAGNAILSRAPILKAVNADVPAVRDKFGSSEKRLGRKRAAVASIATVAGPVTFAQTHLDSNADSKQRTRQLAAILDEADKLGAPVLLGGDLNTTTYQYSSALRLARDICHKLFVTGFRGTINNYLTPERRYETPMFELLSNRGFTVDGFRARPRHDELRPQRAVRDREGPKGRRRDGHALADPPTPPVERRRRRAPRLVRGPRAEGELAGDRAARVAETFRPRSDRGRSRRIMSHGNARVR